MRRAVVLLLLLSAASVTAQDLPRPPFRKGCQITMPAGDEPGSIGEYYLKGDLVYFTGQGRFGAANIATGKMVWCRPLESNPSSEGLLEAIALALDGGRLYVAGPRRLYACDAATGEQLWNLPRRSQATPMLAAGGVLYCELDAGVLTALDTAARKPLWRLPLPGAISHKHPPTGTVFGAGPGPGPPMAPSGTPSITRPPLYAAGRLFVVTRRTGIVCVDPGTGGLLWRTDWTERNASLVSDIVADAHTLYAARGDRKLVALDPCTGRTRWLAPCGSGCDAIALIGDLVAAGCRDGVLRALDRATGRIRWERAVAFPPHDIMSVAAHGNRLLVTASEESRDPAIQAAFGPGSRLLLIEATGKPVWEWTTDDSLCRGPIVHQDGLVFCDYRSFFRLVPGEPPALPTNPEARRALAKDLVARFDALTEDEERVLVRLGDDAFAALLPLVRQRLVLAKEASGRVKEGDEAGQAAADERHNSFSIAMWVLDCLATPARTPDLLALASLDEGEVSILKSLARVGDEAQTIPYFCRRLRKVPAATERCTPEEEALTAVAASRHPEAVRFLVEVLENPGASAQVRATAFLALARNGGAAGVGAVLRERSTERTVPMVGDYLDLSRLPASLPEPGTYPSESGRGRAALVAAGTDRRGVRWGLFHSGILGRHDDLWLCRYDGKRWVEPLFTGETRRPDLGDWIGRLAGNPALTRDTDGDGWTDLVEARIGTDPEKADTDGDGLKDSEDKNPLATPGPLTEEQRVLAAAFEGCFRFTARDDRPYLVELPGGVAPMELCDCDWLVVTARAGNKVPLSKVVGEGLASVTFGPPAYDFEGRENREGKRGRPFLWSPDRSQVKLHLVVHYGSLSARGLDVRLQRFGEHWLAVEVRCIWVA